MSIDDDAERAEQLFRDAAIAERKATATRLLPCGHCLWCDEPVQGGALFCRPDAGGSCRDDFEALEAAKRRNGV